MDASHREAETIDEQLGSPGFTLELGWLLGVLLGALLMVSAVRRRTRRARDTTTQS